MFILEKLVISEDHQKVHQSFHNLNSKIKWDDKHLRKFSKFKDDEGDKVMLEISMSAMDDDYDSQESQNIDINDDIGDDPIHGSMEENLCDVEYNKPLNEVCAAQKYRRTGPIIRYLQEAALPTY